MNSKRATRLNHSSDGSIFLPLLHILNQKSAGDLHAILCFSFLSPPEKFLYSSLLLLMVTAFILGSMLGVFTGQIPRSQETSSAAQSTGWGLSFQEEGKRPAGNASIDDLKQYNAYYASDTDQKIIYLTFDAGYENGNTPAILDALKKHQAPAVFFVVRQFYKR